MINIKETLELKEQGCDLYYKDILILHISTSIQMLDIKCKIKEENSNDYSIKFNDESYKINNFGQVIHHPEGLFEFEDVAYTYLLDIDKDRPKTPKG